MKLICCFALNLLLSTFALSAGTYGATGIVVNVADGDTVVLLVDGHRQMKIRLSSIDAPESSHANRETGRIGQPYSDNSRSYLKALVRGKTVQARCFEADKYGRDVCELFVESRSVNKEMVIHGWAWANVSARGRYLWDKRLPDMEAKARSSHSGLWAGSNPVAPWEWRDKCWTQGKCLH